MRCAPLTALLLWAGCVDPRTAEHLAGERLAGLEDRLAEPLRYTDLERSMRWNPAGLYVEGDRLVVWSRDHVVQQEIDLTTLEQLDRRVGPRRTRRCVVGDGRLAGLTACVGDREPGGVVGFGAPFASGLPSRGGFGDLAMDGRVGRLRVVDAIDAALIDLAPDGSVRGRTPLPAGVTRIGPLGPGSWWLAGHLPPFLWVLSGEVVAPVSPARVAPIRDASYDAATGRLWLVGPADRRVRRAGGPIEGLYSEAIALDGAALRAGAARIVDRVDLRDHALADGVAIAAAGGRIRLAAAGSDAILDRGGRLTVDRGCLGPSAVLLAGDRAVEACRLGDEVRVDGRPVVLDPAPRESPIDLGERLFYADALWRQDGRERITCNSCHWDTRSDRRVHPGFRERRWEVTRPLGGIGAVTPIFSTGGTGRLSRAVEGLLRSLDHRLWDGTPGAWWEYPVTLVVKGGRAVTLSAGEVREALLRFLLSLPAEPPPGRQVGAPLSEPAKAGWPVFARDCASCHRPARSLRSGDVVRDVPSALVERPLVFGAAAFAKVGAGPPVTANGHRVSPLLDLGRGGPWFTSGSAPTLRAVLQRARPGSPRVHGGGDGPAYPPETVEALRAFLIEL